MIRYLSNFGILFIYLLFFWVVIRSSREARIIIFATGFVAGAFSGLLVYLLYCLPYLNIRSFAAIVEELCKFMSVFLFFSWDKPRDLLLKDRNSIVWFGVTLSLNLLANCVKNVRAQHFNLI